MNGGSRPGIWIPWSLMFWVQNRPRYVHVIMMLVGAFAGYIFASSTGRSVKVWTFCGASIGLVSLYLVVVLIGFTVTWGTVAAAVLLAYNVFLVPDGQPWYIPPILTPAYWSAPDAPLTDTQIGVDIWPALLPSVGKARTPEAREAMQKKVEEFFRNNPSYKLIRCTYGRMPEGNPFPLCHFWHERSPVLHRGFPQLPPGPTATVRDFAITSCPPTKREADRVWDRVTGQSGGCDDVAHTPPIWNRVR